MDSRIVTGQRLYAASPWPSRTVSATSWRRGEYWPDALEGMAVVLRSGERLGTVSSLVLGEHQDRIVVVTDEGALVEMPFIEPIVGEVHPSGGFLVVDPPEGLF